jgi:hypothetical protein
LARWRTRIVSPYFVRVPSSFVVFCCWDMSESRRPSKPSSTSSSSLSSKACHFLDSQTDFSLSISPSTERYDGSRNITAQAVERGVASYGTLRQSTPILALPFVEDAGYEPGCERRSDSKVLPRCEDSNRKPADANDGHIRECEPPLDGLACLIESAGSPDAVSSNPSPVSYATLKQDDMFANRQPMVSTDLSLSIPPAEFPRTTPAISQMHDSISLMSSPTHSCLCPIKQPFESQFPCTPSMGTQKLRLLPTTCPDTPSPIEALPPAKFPWSSLTPGGSFVHSPRTPPRTSLRPATQHKTPSPRQPLNSPSGFRSPFGPIEPVPMSPPCHAHKRNFCARNKRSPLFRRNRPPSIDLTQLPSYMWKCKVPNTVVGLGIGVTSASPLSLSISHPLSIPPRQTPCVEERMKPRLRPTMPAGLPSPIDALPCRMLDLSLGTTATTMSQSAGNQDWTVTSPILREPRDHRVRRTPVPVTFDVLDNFDTMHQPNVYATKHITGTAK